MLVVHVHLGFYWWGLAHTTRDLVLEHLAYSQCFWSKGNFQSKSNQHPPEQVSVCLFEFLLCLDCFTPAEYLRKIMVLWVWDMAHQICLLELQLFLSSVCYCYWLIKLGDWWFPYTETWSAFLGGIPTLTRLYIHLVSYFGNFLAIFLVQRTANLPEYKYYFYDTYAYSWTYIHKHM